MLDHVCRRRSKAEQDEIIRRDDYGLKLLIHKYLDILVLGHIPKVNIINDSLLSGCLSMNKRIKCALISWPRLPRVELTCRQGRQNIMGVPREQQIKVK